MYKHYYQNNLAHPGYSYHEGREIYQGERQIYHEGAHPSLKIGVLFGRVAATSAWALARPLSA